MPTRGGRAPSALAPRFRCDAESAPPGRQGDAARYPPSASVCLVTCGVHQWRGRTEFDRTNAGHVVSTGLRCSAAVHCVTGRTRGSAFGSLCCVRCVAACTVVLEFSDSK